MRLPAATPASRPKPTDMAEFLNELKADAERHGHKTNVTFHGYPIVTVKPAAFKRCLANLVSNAARFAGTIDITGHRDHRYLSVTVDDDGRAFRPTCARTCSSRSCGSTTRATRTRAGLGWGLPSPATSPARTAATSRSMRARSGACGRGCGCRCRPRGGAGASRSGLVHWRHEAALFSLDLPGKRPFRPGRRDRAGGGTLARENKLATGNWAIARHRIRLSALELTRSITGRRSIFQEAEGRMVKRARRPAKRAGKKARRTTKAKAKKAKASKAKSSGKAKAKKAGPAQKGKPPKPKPKPAPKPKAGLHKTMGFLIAAREEDWKKYIAAFKKVLTQDKGWKINSGGAADDRVDIDFQPTDGAAGDLELIKTEAKKFVNDTVDVIVTSGTQATLICMGETSQIPIVFAAAGDPEGSGLVADLQNPGGNVTGCYNLQTDSQVQLNRIGLMKSKLNPNQGVGVVGNNEVDAVSTAIGLVWDALNGDVPVAPKDSGRFAASDFATKDTIKAKLASLVLPAGALVKVLYVCSDPLLTARLKFLTQAAHELGMKTMHEIKESHGNGNGDQTYGPDFTALFEKAAEHVDKILRETHKPKDIPVYVPSTFVQDPP